MGLTIVPLEQRHLDDAAELLAARHAWDRARDQALPAAFESPAATRPLLDDMMAQEGTAGVVAVRAGATAGFILASAILPAPRHYLGHFFPPRSMYVPYQAHALASGEDASLYRELYAALAEPWVTRGFYNHLINVAHTDTAAREAWDSLGFGRALTYAVREVAPPVAPPAHAPELEIHRAGPEDIDIVEALNDALWEHHTAAPAFAPHLRESAASWRELSLEQLTEPANVHFVAYRDGQPLGMNAFMAEDFATPLQVPDRCVYLFRGVVYAGARGGGVGRALLVHAMAWAREQGYRWCALHFYSANLSAAAFWLANGFRPLEHRLYRRIDERIAWAGA